MVKKGGETKCKKKFDWKLNSWKRELPLMPRARSATKASLATRATDSVATKASPATRAAATTIRKPKNPGKPHQQGHLCFRWPCWRGAGTAGLRSVHHAHSLSQIAERSGRQPAGNAGRRGLRR